MRVTLWSQDYAEVLHECDGSTDAARAYFLASGKDWLPIAINHGTDLRVRWSGRIERTSDGSVVVCRDLDYLAGIITRAPTITTVDGLVGLDPGLL